MKTNARIQASIEMFNIFFETSMPFDSIMAKFFKQNRFIGAMDRREIAEFSYAIFRKYELLNFFMKNITNNHGRFLVIAYLKIENKYTNDDFEKIFSQEMYAPSKLSPFEIKFIDSIDESEQLPEHVILNYPQWLDPYLKRRFSVEQLEQEMLAINTKASLDLRVNTLKSTKNNVKAKLLETGSKIEDCKISTNGIRVLSGRIGRNHDVLAQGLAEIQDEGSQLIAELCNAQPGQTVVDFCAGAGGKTLAIAANMDNKGRIFALDKYVHRLENAKIRFRRANVNNVSCHEITGKWIKRHVECADIVLVDAPCSGTGTWRRNPDMRAKFLQKDLSELICVQYEILNSACKLVKPGGRLIYATCSVLLEENEDQVSKFLSEFSNFQLEHINLTNYSGEFIKLTPFSHNTDGFFAASMVKNSAE